MMSRKPAAAEIRTDWPVLRSYDQEHIARIALPIGGIGTGTVSLGGRGNLRDWEIVNRPAKGFAPKHTFFALFTEAADGGRTAKALEGPIDVSEYEGAWGSRVPNHGLPRFRHCRFDAAYPLGQVFLDDPDVPVTVRLQAFNPLVPGDADASGIPVAVLRFTLTNSTSGPVVASICGNLQNFIGTDGENGSPKQNRNVFRTSASSPAVSGVFMSSEAVPAAAEQWGTIALVATSTEGVSYRTSWANFQDIAPFSPVWQAAEELLPYWDEFSARGEVTERPGESPGDAPMASLCVRRSLPSHGGADVTFLLTWHFPNRQTWTPEVFTEIIELEPLLKERAGAELPKTIGNYYATRYRDAWDVAVRTVAQLPALEERTLTFVTGFVESDLPLAVKEAGLNNLTALRSQTSFRTPDGHFFGFEGCVDNQGCCYGSATHVWNYDPATSSLFGELARSMREVEFLHATDERGLMSARVNLPLSRAREYGMAAADGQTAAIVRLYRDWQLSGDDDFLRRLWPSARKAMEFCWIEGGWDADQDGVMEGCQHNTMDTDYYGPHPQIVGWYLAALRAAEEMASYLGDTDFAERCRALFERGRAWVDSNLFNGEFYEQQIRPMTDPAGIALGLRPTRRVVAGTVARDTRHPDLQLGPGCLVDQLVGQYMAHVCGLGYLLEPDHVQRTLKSIMRYNFRSSLANHFNHMRSYALDGEAALLMASYPRGARPQRPFIYFNEVMTGFEYTAAVHMLYEGQVDDGLACIEAVRSRYDGRKRSPFDEAECGHHYVRAMVGWAAGLALSGFRYSGVEQSMWFTASTSPARAFWSTGSAWGTCRQVPAPAGTEVDLVVLHGSLSLRRFTLQGAGTVAFEQPLQLGAGETHRFPVPAGPASS